MSFSETYYQRKAKFRVSFPRKGAPFLEAFSSIVHRLEDAGITAHWTNDIIYRKAKKEKYYGAENGDGILSSLTEVKIGYIVEHDTQDFSCCFFPWHFFA